MLWKTRCSVILFLQRGHGIGPIATLLEVCTVAQLVELKWNALELRIGWVESRREWLCWLWLLVSVLFWRLILDELYRIVIVRRASFHLSIFDGGVWVFREDAATSLPFILWWFYFYVLCLLTGICWEVNSWGASRILGAHISLQIGTRLTSKCSLLLAWFVVADVCLKRVLGLLIELYHDSVYLRWRGRVLDEPRSGRVSTPRRVILNI